MAKGKLILICQSGGDFITNEDGTMSYKGGEANAANVTSETLFSDLKLTLAETCDLNQETVTVKYFLPGNKRNLITVKNDKDVKRMIDFHGDALTAEVFVTGTPGFNRSAMEKQTGSQNPTKNDETVKNDNLTPNKDENVGPKKDKKPKKQDKAAKSSITTPARTTRQSIAAAKLEASLINKEKEKVTPKRKRKQKTVPSEGLISDTSSSDESNRVNPIVDLDYSSDYIPSRYTKRKKVNPSPADVDKKRRRTPTWKVGPDGRPTIVSSIRSKSTTNSENKKSQRKSGRLASKGDDEFVGPDSDDDVEPETLVSLSKSKSKSKSNYTQVFPGTMISDKDSYNKLPWFCEKIKETNPGSIANLVIDENKRFKSVFVSFHASLSGFSNSCRPLLFLEATSLRSKYGEVLITANAIDGNDEFIPVAFSIIDVEDDKNWRWFLTQLKAAIVNSEKPITFVFDREKNLKPLVSEVFHDSHIGYSIHHLLESFKRNVKGPFHGDAKSFLLAHFLDAAHAVRPAGFKKLTEQIKQISSQAYDWVMQIEPHHWASSSFKGERFNHVIDDVSEAVTKLIEENRELPILRKVEAVIRMMVDGFNDAKLDGSMWSTNLTPSKEKRLREELVKSSGLKVLISSDTLFEVREESTTHVVNIANWSCTCLRWKETGLPCRHALAVFSSTGKNTYEFCSNYFMVDAYRLTYAESINAVSVDKGEGEKMEIETSGGLNGQVLKVEGENGEPLKEECENGEERIEIGTIGGENEEVGKVEGENEQALKEECEKGEEKIEVETIGGENEEVGKVEGENEQALKEECEKGEEKIEIGTIGGESEEVGKVEGEKDEGVFVLPPIPVKIVDLIKEKMDWDEMEMETKRTVTCTKCKQPGHNKKSCNLYQVDEGC